MSERLPVGGFDMFLQKAGKTIDNVNVINKPVSLEETSLTRSKS